MIVAWELSIDSMKGRQLYLHAIEQYQDVAEMLLWLLLDYPFVVNTAVMLSLLVFDYPLVVRVAINAAAMLSLLLLDLPFVVRVGGVR